MLPAKKRGEGRRILVVDEEPALCRSCKEILAKDGFLVDSACSGEEGLKMGLERDYDLVILDVKIPDRSGMELLKRLRGERKDLSVVMISADSTVESAVEAMRLGAKDFVPKPFTPGELSRVVRSSIRKEEGAGRIPGEQIIPGEMVQRALQGARRQAAGAAGGPFHPGKIAGGRTRELTGASPRGDSQGPPLVPGQPGKEVSRARLSLDQERLQPAPRPGGPGRGNEEAGGGEESGPKRGQAAGSAKIRLPSCGAGRPGTPPGRSGPRAARGRGLKP